MKQASRTTADSLHVRLYVAPNSRASSRARRNLETAVDILEPSELELEVVDVTREPERAARDGALVTPLLVRVSPKPVRKIGGTLDDQKSLVALLSGLY